MQKLRQDFFLDRLNGQLQEMIEQKDLLLAQIKAQKADMEVSRTAIQESQRESHSLEIQTSEAIHNSSSPNVKSLSAVCTENHCL